MQTHRLIVFVNLFHEVATLFKCTVCGFHALYKWAGGGAPSQAMELQEMGVDGQGITEPGGSNDD